MPFSKSVASALAHRSGFICSNPTCHALTIMPTEGSLTAYTHKGNAAHIHGEKVNTPRYLATMTVDERKSPANGIWLCSSCHDLIDKGDGNGFTDVQLRKWKSDHEALIRKTALAATPGLPLAQLRTKDAKIARDALTFLNDRAVFFNPSQFENGHHVIQSLRESRDYFVQQIQKAGLDSRVKMLFETIQDACRAAMNATSANPHHETLNAALEMLRSQVGMTVARMCKDFDLPPPRHLSMILPSSAPRYGV